MHKNLNFCILSNEFKNQTFSWFILLPYTKYSSYIRNGTMLLAETYIEQIWTQSERARTIHHEFN
jgi:hypothetical protein